MSSDFPRASKTKWLRRDGAAIWRINKCGFDADPSRKSTACCFAVASHKYLNTVGAMFSKIISALSLTVLLSSCATVVRGVHEDFKVVSDPAGADVYLSTGEKGVTPATFRKRRRGNSFLVTITKPGYYSQTVTVKSKGSATGAAATAGNAVSYTHLTLPTICSV